MRFKYARPELGELADGRPLVFGDFVVLDRAAVTANRRLIQTGALNPAPRRKPPTKKRSDRGPSGTDHHEPRRG
jgi:hypothetical protein